MLKNKILPNYSKKLAVLISTQFRMEQRIKEWLRQSEYDYETARYMFDGGRYFYAVFMAHLSVEKLLKGLYQHRLDEIPPRTHNLIYLATKCHLDLNEEDKKFLIKLNEAQIVTRYPEYLNEISREYSSTKTEDILSHVERLRQWIKKMF